MQKTRLLLRVGDPEGKNRLSSAARQKDIEVLLLSPDPRHLLEVYRPGLDIVRAPGGLIAAAKALGLNLQLQGPTAAWFASLSTAVTGRQWYAGNAALALKMAAAGPLFVKLADGKLRSFPARRYADVSSLSRALAALDRSQDVQLLFTPGWLPLRSEYRVFTVDRQALTSSPYLVEGVSWEEDLPNHQHSMHAEALAFAAEVLRDVPEAPPAAALDVALTEAGRFVLLEANQAFSAALYGCDADSVLRSVQAANGLTSARWKWVADPALG